uniref:Sidoreflexin n=1 Tax=Rattus norvegicus TaxID=10116 RepID=A0ABK0LQK8_RAT
MGDLPLNINIQEPRWDQSTFLGRARHFFTVTDPRNLLLSGKQLEASRNIVQNYRAGVVTPGLTEDQLWRAKYVYDSAFHPDTGEKVVLIGRMSAQVPMNMTITGCMLTFYRKTPTMVFWQWVNQSFNAIVNYSNRSGDAPITVQQLGTAYVSATTGAVATALGLKSLTKHLPPLVGRFVPFAAVAAANCINIPLMRQRELQVGIPVTDEAGQRLGHSVTAAKQGIFQVVVSRIGMAIPAMGEAGWGSGGSERRALGGSQDPGSETLSPECIHLACAVLLQLYTCDQAGAGAESSDPSTKPQHRCGLLQQGALRGIGLCPCPYLLRLLLWCHFSMLPPV